MILFLPFIAASFCPDFPRLRVLRPLRGSSTRHRSDCGMHPQWRRLGSRIEYRIARSRVDFGRGELGCVVRGGTHQSLEPISKSPEEDNEAGELNKAQEILGMVLPADENSALPLDPSEEALNEPAAHIAG